MVERLLERQRAENNGKYPETIAVVLWGTDNIKTYGESLAQVGQPGYVTADCGRSIVAHNQHPLYLICSGCRSSDMGRNPPPPPPLPDLLLKPT